MMAKAIHTLVMCNGEGRRQENVRTSKSCGSHHDPCSSRDPPLESTAVIAGVCFTESPGLMANRSLRPTHDAWVVSCAPQIVSRCRIGTLFSFPESCPVPVCSGCGFAVSCSPLARSAQRRYVVTFSWPLRDSSPAQIAGVFSANVYIN